MANKFGPQVDLGSNDELLWFWIRNNPPPALYFCHHSQFAASSARQVLPVEPDWLIEAMGVINFDTAQNNIEGPFPVGKGRVEIKSRPIMPGGNSRITMIDDSRGIVLQEDVYDVKGIRIASAVMSKHLHDPASERTLPRHVEIQWPTTHFSLSIDMADLKINQLTAPPADLFTKPTYPGYNEVDLRNPTASSCPARAARTKARRRRDIDRRRRHSRQPENPNGRCSRSDIHNRRPVKDFDVVAVPMDD